MKLPSRSSVWHYILSTRLLSMTGFFFLAMVAVAAEVPLGGGWRHKYLLPVVDFICGTSTIVALVWLILVTIGSIAKRRYLRLVWAWLLGAGLFFILVIVAMLSTFASSMIEEDNFAYDLQLPTDVVLDEPVARPPEFVGKSGDVVGGNPSIPRNSAKSEFILHKGFQGGLYQAEIWANTHEPGWIYLKAYEITKGTPLSVERLKSATNGPIGADRDPNHTYLARPEFTIYEGNWGEFYGARFEVWFEPSRGGPERRLMTRNYKIEGWQR